MEGPRSLLRRPRASTASASRLLSAAPCLALVLLASCGSPATSGDAAPDARDAAGDALGDAAMDAAADVAGDAAQDAASDAPVDAASDVPADTGSDAPAEAGCDGGVCGGACVDLATDVHHCGQCAHDCTALPGVDPSAVRCAAGACVLAGACLPGRADCTPSADDGCEADLASPSTCGACGTDCPAPANGAATCAAGHCGVACDPGFVLTAGACAPAPAPRPIAPLSTATTTTRRPALRWALATGGDGAHVQLCADRACATVLTEFDAAGASGAPAADLPVGVVFWRVRARGASAPGAAWSATWQFTVPARSAARDGSFGTAPDVNGDGYADVLVGAPRTNGDAGRVHVYQGGPAGVPSTPTTWIDGPDGGSAWFGENVASAGDVNGDGFADVVVGAYMAGDYRGRAHVYLGGPAGLAATPSATLAGPDLDGYFSMSVASAGDVNGDGYADVLVGAPYVSSNSGRVYLYLGGPSGLATTPSASLVSVEGSFSYFGMATAGAGDVNGDGFADVVVGAYGAGVPGPSGPVPWVGRVHVYFGSAAGLPAAPSVSLDGPDGANGYFGYAVDVAGDVNGDGLCDVLVGAHGVASNAGRVYVFAGHTAGLLGLPTTTLTAPDGANGHFGFDAAMAGDVNGDGFTDVIASANNANAAAGRAYVFLGGASGLGAAPTPRLDGLGVGEFGHSVAGLGDVDGDHFADVAVGAINVDSTSGYAQLFSGGASGVSASSARQLSTPDPMADYGFCIARAESDARAPAG